MAEQVFCYHCRRYHPAEQMLQVMVGSRRTRWRCRTSVDAARMGREQRDSFGKGVTAMNKLDGPRSLPHCVKEILGAGFAEKVINV